MNGTNLERAKRVAASLHGGRQRIDNITNLYSASEQYKYAGITTIKLAASAKARWTNWYRSPRTAHNGATHRFLLREIGRAATNVAVLRRRRAARVYKKDEAPVFVLRRKRQKSRRKNPFINAKAGVDEEAGVDEDESEAEPAMRGIIVKDDVHDLLL